MKNFPTRAILFFTLFLCSKCYASTGIKLWIYPDNMNGYVHMNKDSVAKDTSSGSPTFNRWYSKRYNLYFRVNAFHLGYGSPDSVLIVHWENIDTIYKALRDSMHSIYVKWGPFYLQKMNPDDTSHSFEGFKMIFNNFILADAGVLNDLA